MLALAGDGHGESQQEHGVDDDGTHSLKLLSGPGRAALVPRGGSISRDLSATAGWGGTAGGTTSHRRRT